MTPSEEAFIEISAHAKELGIEQAVQIMHNKIIMWPLLGNDTAGKAVWLFWWPFILLNARTHEPYTTLPIGITILHELIHIQQGWWSAVRDLFDEAHHEEREKVAENAVNLWYDVVKR